MKKLSFVLSLACILSAMQAQAECGSVISPSQAAQLAQNGDKGSYCIEGYVVSTVDIYTAHYDNQSFMMADAQGGEAVFEAWRVTGADHTIGIGSFVRIADATLQMYNDIAETKAGFTVEIISEVPTVIDLPEFGTEMTASEAEEYCLMLPYHDTPTEDMFIVSGYAVAVEPSETDEEIFTVYLSDTPGGETSFQAWECHAIRNILGDVMPVAEGDLVYVTGHLSRYNKNAQIKGGYVATTAVDPFAIRLTPDPDRGTAQINGTTVFTLADMNDMECTLTAMPDNGYEFVMWIDPRFIDPSDPDAATGMQVAQTVLEWYDMATQMTEEQIQEYLAEQDEDRETFDRTIALIEKIRMPEMTLRIQDLEAWAMLNGLDSHVFRFMPVFREIHEDIDNVQSDKGQCTKVIENGTLYLMYKGAKYNVQGAKCTK